jgi:hypothetical protein
MKGLIVRFLVFLSILAILDFIIGSHLDYLYFNQVAGTCYETNYVIKSSTEDIIILGSSRASHHYIPNILEDSLKLSTYNGGRNGNFLLYGSAIFKSIVKRHHPKVIIFDLSPGELYWSSLNYQRLSSLLPYAKHYPEIKDIVLLRSGFENIKLLSSVYPFNSLLYEIITGQFYLSKFRESVYKGYIPLKSRLNKNELLDVVDIKRELDTNAIKALSIMAKKSKEVGIRFVVVTSPLYSNFKESYSESYLKRFADDNNFDYISFLNDSSFLNHPELFNDPKHLNDDGAKKFTMLLLQKLK